MSTDTAEIDADKGYRELAHQSMLLERYRRYRKEAQGRLDAAIAEETESIEGETRRIEATEALVRELVARLGLAGEPKQEAAND